MGLTLLARADFDAGDLGIAGQEGVWPFESGAPRTKGSVIVRAQKPIKVGQRGPFKEASNPNLIPPIF